jgi:hypothetical protein
MQIDEVKNYRGAFKTIAYGSFIIIGIAIVVFAGTVIYLYKKSQIGYNSIWIVDPKSSTVVKADQVLSAANPEREFEYRNHVTMFLHDWFEFDQFNFKEHINQGINYLGNCGPSMLNDYNTQDLGRRLIEKNMKCTIQIDSIQFDMGHVPVRGACFAIQTIASPAGSKQRKIYATFTMHDLEGRSNKNPHGVLIDDMKFFDTSTIEPAE